MQTKRNNIWRLIYGSWCPSCKAPTLTEIVKTGLPGITARQCTKCDMGIQANFIEDADDLVEIPDNNFELLPDNFCLSCQKVTDFVLVYSDINEKYGCKCKSCGIIYLPNQIDTNLVVRPENPEYETYYEKTQQYKHDTICISSTNVYKNGKPICL